MVAAVIRYRSLKAARSDRVIRMALARQGENGASSFFHIHNDDDGDGDDGSGAMHTPPPDVFSSYLLMRRWFVTACIYTGLSPPAQQYPRLAKSVRKWYPKRMGVRKTYKHGLMCVIYALRMWYSICGQYCLGHLLSRELYIVSFDTDV